MAEFIAFKRDIEAENQTVALLLQQYEKAKIDGKSKSSAILVVDEPFKPVYKSKPKRVILLVSVI